MRPVPRARERRSRACNEQNLSGRPRAGRAAPDSVAGLRRLELANVHLHNSLSWHGEFSSAELTLLASTLSASAMRWQVLRFDVCEFESSQPSHGVGGSRVTVRSAGRERALLEPGLLPWLGRPRSARN